MLRYQLSSNLGRYLIRQGGRSQRQQLTFLNNNNKSYSSSSLKELLQNTRSKQGKDPEDIKNEERKFEEERLKIEGHDIAEEHHDAGPYQDDLMYQLHNMGEVSWRDLQDEIYQKHEEPEEDHGPNEARTFIVEREEWGEEEEYNPTYEPVPEFPLELNKPEKADKIPPPPPKLPQGTYGVAHGVGGRKSSTARVSLFPSKENEGRVFINGIPMVDYFPLLHNREAVLAPLLITERLGHFDVKVYVKGGGTTGQSEAIRMAMAQALQNHDPMYRLVLKHAGLLTRDPRIKERKKPGRKKARKKGQWSKR